MKAQAPNGAPIEQLTIPRNANDAEAMFRGGFNCAHAVLSWCSRDLELSEDPGERVRAMFGGGIGAMGLTCGAVTGALMAIRLKYARAGNGGEASPGRAKCVEREFTKRFVKLHGSICCKELLGIDISTAEGLDQAAAAGLFTTRCPAYVRDSAALVEHLFTEEELRTVNE
jgi:C_GCAxxG_C_C family probable redox protein